MRSCVWGVLAVNAGGDTLANINAPQRMIPASNTKLITTGLALRTFGSEHRFRTGLAYAGEIVDGVLQGDLYIVGGGDPTLGSNQYDNVSPIEEVFGSWLDSLRKAGIGRIEGRIIGDNRFFNKPSFNWAWMYGDIGEDYNAVPEGLSFNENIQELRISPADEVHKPAVVETAYPVTAWRHIRSSVETGVAGSGSSLYFEPSVIGNDALLSGHIAINRNPRRLFVSNNFGAMTCASEFASYLDRNGFKVDGGFSDVATIGESEEVVPDSCLVVIGATYSPTLKEIISDTNHESDNFYAEMLLLQVAKALEGETGYNACDNARQAVLENLGVGMKNCQIYDGSGLSHLNCVSPEFFVTYLGAMRKTPEFNDFLNSLPQPGNGTLVSRLKKAPQQLRSRVYMKSGSVLGVLCYSGYIMSSDGNPQHDVMFSILINCSTGSSSALGRIIDNIIESIGNE